VAHATMSNGVELCRASQLSVQLSEAAAPIWRDLYFSISADERVAIIGPNGSGKSTLLATLAGLMWPTSGTIEWSAGNASQSAVGLLPQNPDLALLTSSVRDELAFSPRQAGLTEGEVATRVDVAARRFELDQLLDELPQSLSQGERLRVALASLAAMQPAVLLLDEPTTGQDQRHVAALMETLVRAVTERSWLQALVFATHDLHAVLAYATRVLVLANGQLLANCSPERLLDDHELRETARLRLPPLFELRDRLGLKGRSLVEMMAELAARRAGEGA